LSGLGVYRYRKERSARIFLGWIAAGALYVPLLGKYGLIHRYTLLPLAPIAAVWIACGLAFLMEKAGSRSSLKALVIILLIAIPFHAGLRIGHWYRVEYRYLYALRDFLTPISHPEDLILTSTHEKPVHLYYLDHYGYSVEPADWQPADVDRFIARGVRFILIPTEDNGPRLAEWKSCMTSRATLIKEAPEYLLYRTGWSTSVPARQG
jgi:hypothetical protein